MSLAEAVTERELKILKVSTLAKAIFFLFLVVFFAIVGFRSYGVYVVAGLVGSAILLTYNCFKLDILFNIK